MASEAMDSHWYNWTQRANYVEDWNTVRHYYPVHYNSRSFYDYARLSEQMRQRMYHKGVKVLVYQQGQYGDPGYVAPDVTVGIIDPIIVYPDLRTGLDVPGRTGGPEIDHDNSLTIPGHSNMAAPVTPEATIPAHTVDSWIENLVEYINLTDDMLGDTATVTVTTMSRNVTSVPPSVPSLEVGDVDFQYYNGSAWVSVTPTETWEGALQIEFSHVFPAAAYDGEIRFRARFNSGVVETEYEYTIKLDLDDAKLFEVYEQFDVSS